MLDQIEEFFTGNEEMEAEREVLFRALHFLCQTGDVWIVGTLRSDFYSTALSSEALKELKGAKGSFDLTVPNDASFRRMIEEPARLAGLKWGERKPFPFGPTPVFVDYATGHNGSDGPEPGFHPSLGGLRSLGDYGGQPRFSGGVSRP